MKQNYSTILLKVWILFWENKIIDMLKIRGSKPNVMHNRIIQDYPKLFLGVDDKVIPNNQSHLVDCDHIPHPSLDRIRNSC